MTLGITVTVIVLLLIVLKIAFEKAKEHIEESADHNMKPIIGSLLGEMTVLGFLSNSTYCVTQLGFFEHISTSLFREEEELQETFEFVHYICCSPLSQTQQTFCARPPSIGAPTNQIFGGRLLGLHA
jgi:hypothetical protein